MTFTGAAMSFKYTIEKSYRWRQAFENNDWQGLEKDFPFYRDMRDCMQDNLYHAEGDVWTHTRMVFDALEQYGLASDGIARLGALFHDIMKPKTREVIEKDGCERVSHPHHARLGAAEAFFHMWLAGYDYETRCQVHHLIAWHQRVFHMLDYSNPDKKMLEYASIAPWSRLINFGRADLTGRIGSDKTDTFDSLLLIEDYLKELDILDKGYDWDDASRIFYFEKDGRLPTFQAQEPKGSRIIITSGLPGSGKDTSISRLYADLPVVSLDRLRLDMKTKRGDDEGRVYQAAFEEARSYLRKGDPFIWNATCLTKMMRGKILSLARQYDAHTTILVIDCNVETLLYRNANRQYSVPQDAILKLAIKQEPVSRLEAHNVIVIDNSDHRRQ